MPDSTINDLFGSNNNDFIEDIRSPYIKDPQAGLELITKLISKSNQYDDITKILNKIEYMIKKEFLIITRENESSGGADAYAQLLSLFDTIVDIAHFPEIENKFIVTVGGQFSSGKSKFLNSHLNYKSLLPESTEPTTAIPTYLLNGKKSEILALNYYRNHISIKEDALHAISHEFNKKYNLSFAHILKLITIERSDFPYKNLIFLDTPGYSKPDTMDEDGEKIDREIAQKHLKTADYMIWLVDIQSGTIPKSDIDFIKELAFKEPILFVINKADKKMPSDVHKIVQKSKEDLTRAKISFIDVVAYSSKTHKEYSETENVIKNFFDKIEQGSISTYIIQELNHIFEQYMAYFDSEKYSLRSAREIVNKISTRMEEELTDEEQDRFRAFNKREQKKLQALNKNEEPIKELQKKLNKQLKELLKTLDIQILTGEKVKFRREASQSKPNLFRFEAIAVTRNQTNLEKIPDWKKIKGEVQSVSSLGVTVLSSQYQIEYYISKKTLLNQIKNYKQYLEEKMEVSIHLVSTDKAIIEFRLNIEN